MFWEISFLQNHLTDDSALCMTGKIYLVYIQRLHLHMQFAEF